MNEEEHECSFCKKQDLRRNLVLGVTGFIHAACLKQADKRFAETNRRRKIEEEVLGDRIPAFNRLDTENKKRMRLMHRVLMVVADGGKMDNEFATEVLIEAIAVVVTSAFHDQPKLNLDRLTKAIGKDIVNAVRRLRDDPGGALADSTTH